ncbi:hypothetical protein PALB_28980 [Pseudoalteromonas luteoviolacea B = ATCC 29581]|nr:hypothetical protein PALB_28980 [Pseudoalteromonas luteoviolacea B = ATCC 29581]
MKFPKKSSIASHFAKTIKFLAHNAKYSRLNTGNGICVHQLNDFGELNMKKHIGLLVPTFPVASETFIVTEANALAKIGHKVTIFTFKLAGVSSTLLKNIDVVEISAPIHSSTAFYMLKHPIKSLQITKLAKSLNMISTSSLLAWSIQLSNLIDKYKVKHLHCHFLHGHASYGCLAAKLSDITVSGVGHGHDVYINNKDLNGNLRMFNFVVAVCDEMANHFVKLIGPKTKLLHCGINTHFFKPQTSRAKESTHLVFVGRLVEKKGLVYLVQAMAKINRSIPLYIDIVGDGPLKNDLMALVQKHNLQSHIHFLGAKDPTWLKDNLPNYSGFVAPFCQAENGDRDTGPVVLKEAMACGLPVITSDFMGCKEIVGDVGILCKPKDSESIKDGLLKFNSLTPHQRLELGRKAVLRVNQLFDATTQAKKMSMWIQGARAC